MSKKFGFVVALLFVAILPNVSFAQGVTKLSVEANATVAAGTIKPQANIYGTRESGKFGGFAWIMVQGGYAEFEAGPLFSPSKNLQLGLGAGFDQTKNDFGQDTIAFRVLASAFASSGSFSLLIIGEQGGSGAWYKAVALKNFEHFAAGFNLQRNKGIGPRFEVKGKHLKVWIAQHWDFEDNNRPKTMVGTKVSF